jgi:hypothetical protein
MQCHSFRRKPLVADAGSDAVESRFPYFGLFRNLAA